LYQIDQFPHCSESQAGLEAHSEPALDGLQTENPETHSATLEHESPATQCSENAALDESPLSVNSNGIQW